jgi:hypothetical protein
MDDDDDVLITAEQFRRMNKQYNNGAVEAATLPTNNNGVLSCLSLSLYLSLYLSSFRFCLCLFLVLCNDYLMIVL